MLDTGLVFTTYSKIARGEGPEPARGAFRVPIGVPCVTPPSRRPSAAEPSARGSGREKKLRGADGAAVGRVPRPRRRVGEAGATRLVDARAAASRRRADLIEGALHGADVKRRRRRRAGDDVRAVHGPLAVTRRQAESSSILEHVKEQSFSEGGRLLLVRAFAERPGLRRAAARSLVRRRLGAVDARGCCRARRLRRQGCRMGRLGLVDLYRGPRRGAQPVLRAAPSAFIICATSASARAPAAARALAFAAFGWTFGFWAFLRVCLFPTLQLFGSLALGHLGIFIVARLDR